MEVDLERLNSPPGEGGYKNTHPLEEVVINYIPHLERWCGKNTQALWHGTTALCHVTLGIARRPINNKNLGYPYI